MNLNKNLKRTLLFLRNRHKEFLTAEFWTTVIRVLRNRFNFFDRISNSKFLYNLEQIEIRPWNLHIENSNICNANCIFCAYQHQTRKKVIMDKSIYSKALRDYCSIGGGELRLLPCVGDPLVDPNFLELIQEARSYPAIKEIGFITNGINLNKTGIEQILQSGINEIQISTGPLDENLYEQIYRTKNYHKVINNIKELLNKNREYGNKINIKLLFRTNLSMKETLLLPDYQSIKHLPHTSEFNTDFDTWLGTIQQKDLLNGMHIRPVSQLDREPCYWFYDGPHIFSDGTAGVCGCRDFNADSELILGNIMEHSLLELWQSEKLKKLRRRFHESDFPDICKKCTQYANLDFYRSKRGSLRTNLVTEWFKDANKKF